MEIAQTADYALQTLLTLQGRGPSTEIELASAMQVSRTAAHRIVLTLHRRGFVLRLEDGRYTLGPELIKLSANTPIDLVSISAHHLESLAQFTKETVVLAVPHGENAVVLDQRQGTQGPLRVEYRTGFSHSLTRGASGLAILAYLERDCQDLLIRKAGDPDLRARLHKVVAEGYSLSSGELRAGMVGLAVPIVVNGVGVVGSIALVVPDLREVSLKDNLDDLKRHARGIALEYSSVIADATSAVG
ncbi:IclR family transcriptional regulator C-terminal domain-containing protein [Arthrobacter sp. Cr_A7]|uniref:IclR family transcriptional regulator n=1 Tax=Arthrobacter sp. Cr_A7 TaxID=3031017 RepID=UPI0023DC9C84|nr:IclR family transcriptional regulator C-terminal domain-containing protein [Arthrobacter sp. Cr_A7]MDF2050427.1 IclR family transcriptional regulator C-terminal domain-containing protein [Arthrobacter sp. Cr_A7]